MQLSLRTRPEPSKVEISRQKSPLTTLAQAESEVQAMPVFSLQ